MTLNIQHILYKKQTNQTRWYDNPDVVDILFTFFNEQKELQDKAICIHSWNAEKGIGYHRYKMDNEGNVTAKKITYIKDKILFYPILTISTTNNEAVNKKLQFILDNSINQQVHEDIAKAIIVPILMHHNHFGNIIILPQEHKVLYFNSYGAKSNYNDEEKIIKDFFNYKNYEFTINNTVYQQDGNSCGPFVIEFSLLIAQAILEGRDINTSLDKLHKQNQEDFLFTIGKYRNKHASFVNGKPTNYSLPILLQTQYFLKQSKELENELSFKINLESAYEKNEKQCKHHSKENLIDNIDIFEAQEKTVKYMTDLQTKFNPIKIHYNKSELVSPLDKINNWFQAYARPFVTSIAGLILLYTGYSILRKLYCFKLSEPQLNDETLVTFLSSSNEKNDKTQNFVYMLYTQTKELIGYNL